MVGVSFVQIPVHLLEAFWPECESLLQMALDYSRSTLKVDKLKSLIEDRKIQLWVAAHLSSVIACVVTKVHTMADGNKIGAIEYCSGVTLDDYVETIETFEKYFKTNACESIQIPSRKGWGNAFDGRGYKPVYQVLEKQL